MTRRMGFMLSAVLAIGACTQMTPTQQGALSGTAIGAASGAGIAALADGDAGVGALAGGALGALAGGMWGSRQQQSQYQQPRY